MSTGQQHDESSRARSRVASNISPGWRFLHAPKGTCIPGCPAFGSCHCGCGARPKLSRVTHEPSNRVIGQPFTFVSGHQLRVVHPRAGIWSKNGVPVERIRPLLLWLRERHGTVRVVSLLLEMPEATVRGYLYNRKRRRVPPGAARRITALVLAHRTRARTLDLWEEEPALRAGMRLLPERRRNSRRGDEI